jgi:hypothetical protein
MNIEIIGGDTETQNAVKSVLAGRGFDAQTPQWKHGEFFPIENPEAVAVFDDEKEGHDTIYLMAGGKFSPCRDVSRSDRGRWKDILLAWSMTAPLKDMRNNQEVPLP